MAETSAPGEPDTPPNSVQANTLLMPRPPRTCPSMLRAKSTILSATPPYSISSPAKMKNGMARKEKMFIPEVICWKPTASGMPSYSRVARADRPMENATGTPSSRKAVKLRERMSSGIVIEVLISRPVRLRSPAPAR
jgi:hypothetical protein